MCNIFILFARPIALQSKMYIPRDDLYLENKQPLDPAELTMIVT